MNKLAISVLLLVGIAQTQIFGIDDMPLTCSPTEMPGHLAAKSFIMKKLRPTLSQTIPSDTYLFGPGAKEWEMRKNIIANQPHLKADVHYNPTAAAVLQAAKEARKAQVKLYEEELAKALQERKDQEYIRKHHVEA